MNVGAGKHVIAPFRPLAGAQVVLAFSNAPGGGHQQGKTKVGGGFGQHIGRIGGQYAGSGHGVQVKIVVANGHVGANFQVGASGQYIAVDRVTAGGKRAGLTLQSLDQFSLGPNHIGLVGFNLEMLLQLSNDFGKNCSGN